MCCFVNPLMRYIYNTGKFMIAMMNEQTFNQMVTVGLLLPKALTFSLKSPQRHVLRKIQLKIWDFFPYCHYDSYCVQKVLSLCFSHQNDQSST